MPRYVKNAWVRLDVDGKAKRIETGPKSSGGGLNQTILLREKGSISDVNLQVWVHVITKDGKDYVVCEAWFEGEKTPKDERLKVELER